jgi:hypothetical protein
VGRSWAHAAWPQARGGFGPPPLDSVPAFSGASARGPRSVAKKRTPIGVLKIANGGPSLNPGAPVLERNEVESRGGAMIISFFESLF